MELDEQQEELFRQRKKGVLPEIEFPGQIYVVDWRERVLRAADRLDVEPIRLSERKRGFYGDNNFLIYDTEKKAKIEYRPEFPYSTINMVLLKIPGGIILDPVGAARENGLDERRFVANNPISARIVAEVIEISRKEMRKLVNAYPQRPVEVKKPRKYNSKGKGI